MTGQGADRIVPTTSAEPAGVVVEFAAQSETGPVRAANEDHVGWDRLALPDPAHDRGYSGQHPIAGACDERPGTGVAIVVADGLGSYGGGEVASRLAVTTFLDHLAASGPAARVPASVRSGFDLANQAIFDAALAGAGARRMQTTLSALVLTPGEAHLGHVGDCRVYRLRDGVLDLLTTDHTQVMEMLRLRLIDPDQAAEHPGRYALTRSVGGDIAVRPEIRKETLHEGDAYLLCSDGLWSKVGAGEIQQALRRDDLAETCRVLIGAAIERGGDDNATAIAVRIRQSGQARSRQRSWWRQILS